MNTQELLKKAREIELKAFKTSHQTHSGDYSSKMKGTGINFAEVRKYQYGDNVKDIDWNKTARFNDTYVKVFEEDKENVIMIAVDITASTIFGTKQRYKNELIAEIVASLAMSSIKSGLKIGLVLFSDKVDKYIKPALGKNQVMKMIVALLEQEPKKVLTALASVTNLLGKTLRKGSTVVMISDYNFSGYEEDLNICANRFNLIGMRVYDEKEKEIPDVGYINIEDLETGKIMLIDTSSRAIRENYKQYYSGILDRATRSFRKAGAYFMNISTDEDYVKPLMTYFNK